MSLQREIKVLEEKLQEVEGWERRVKELEVLLGTQEGVGDDIKTKGEMVVAVEGDREESEERLLRAMEREEQERVVDDSVESVVSASLVSVSDVDAAEEGSEVEFGLGDRGGQVSVTEDGIVVDIGFEEAVDQEELEMGS